MKNKKLIFFSFIGVILILIYGLVGYYIGKKQTSVQSINRLTPTLFISPPPIQTITSDQPNNWKIYKNFLYKFQLSYPSTYKDLTDPMRKEFETLTPVLILAKNEDRFDIEVFVIDKAEFLSKFKDGRVGYAQLINEKNGRVFILAAENPDNYGKEINQIFSTFKFLE